MAEPDHLIALRSAPIGYAQDYTARLERQIGLLRECRFEELDVANLLDEVEGLSRLDFKSFAGAIEIVLLYMLKWDHQPGRRGRSWAGSILEHRTRIAQELEDSPSYRARIDEAVARAYKPARSRAWRQTRLPLADFPATCPYDWKAITCREHPLEG